MSVEQCSKYNWFERLCMNIVKSGEVPKHVAFIMDGNRRFAKENKISKAEGHSLGFDKMMEILDICYDLGITDVTVYAFSIENFKRAKEEVENLINLAKNEFRRFLHDKRDGTKKTGFRRVVIGDFSLMDTEFKDLSAQCMLFTKNNKRLTFNMAFAYTSREEMKTAIKTIVEGVENKKIEISDISEDLLNSCLYTRKSASPDLLIRTSGEVRFSDFLLWQSSATILYFTPVLWPGFRLWKLLQAILFYQRQVKKIRDFKEYKQNLNDPTETEGGGDRVKYFLNEQEQKYWTTVKSYVTGQS